MALRHFGSRLFAARHFAARLLHGVAAAAAAVTQGPWRKLDGAYPRLRRPLAPDPLVLPPVDLPLPASPLTAPPPPRLVVVSRDGMRVMIDAESPFSETLFADLSPDAAAEAKRIAARRRADDEAIGLALLLAG